MPIPMVGWVARENNKKGVKNEKAVNCVDIGGGDGVEPVRPSTSR
ncbi:hypothetical protein ES703_91587 [subsurface metagenome]